MQRLLLSIIVVAAAGDIGNDHNGVGVAQLTSGLPAEVEEVNPINDSLTTTVGCPNLAGQWRASYGELYNAAVSGNAVLFTFASSGALKMTCTWDGGCSKLQCSSGWSGTGTYSNGVLRWSSGNSYIRATLSVAANTSLPAESVKTAVGCASLAGQWRASYGTLYNAVMSGNAVLFTYASSGSLKMTCTWDGGCSKLSCDGDVTGTYSSGVLRWNTGNSYIRATLSLGEQVKSTVGCPNLAGQWRASYGELYNAAVSGNAVLFTFASSGALKMTCTWDGGCSKLQCSSGWSGTGTYSNGVLRWSSGNSYIRATLSVAANRSLPVEPVKSAVGCASLAGQWRASYGTLYNAVMSGNAVLFTYASSGSLKMTCTWDGGCSKLRCDGSVTGTYSSGVLRWNTGNSYIRATLDDELMYASSEIVV